VARKAVEDVVRAGYREAIGRAQDARKPIESLWVCAKEDRFQVYMCEGPGRSRSSCSPAAEGR
jgi:hypothetical protein